MIKIDEEKGRIFIEEDGIEVEYPMDHPEAFRRLSRAWLRAGWDAKHVYSFTWLGRPMIQLPEDMVRLQEVIVTLRPDAIVEVGVAHGGSLVFHAGLCKILEHGRVIGVDIEIRPHNRKALESHPLFPWITLIEGDSADPSVVERVREAVGDSDTVLVILDGNHSRDHVAAELEAYAPLVSVGSYIIAADGVMRDLAGAPRSNADWTWNNPAEAAREFVRRHPEFAIEAPEFAFNEGSVDAAVTYWPDGYIKRKR